MPYCAVVDKDQSALNDAAAAAMNNGINIFYRTYGRGPTKILLITGLAGTHDSWGPQLKGLAGTDMPNDDDDKEHDSVESGDGGGGIEICAFDNRGMGRSSIPVKKTQYTTKIMARDAIALLDHLGWKQAHVFGHSMGAMISCKLAAMAPERVLSLALLNVTGGGFECCPKLDLQTFSIAFRFLRAKTPEKRAAVDLDTHYSKEYLEEYVGSTSRRAILCQLNYSVGPDNLSMVAFFKDKLAEYVKGISATGMQSNYGFDGQIHACWMHKMTQKDIQTIRSAGFLVSVIHGRHDIIAQICYARRLAEKLYPVARMIDLHGGHLVSHERTEEVNQALIDLINASKKKLSPQDWTNLSQTSSGFLAKGMSFVRTSTGRRSYISEPVEKLHLYLVFLSGLFMIAFEYARRLLHSLKPVRVGASPT